MTESELQEYKDYLDEIRDQWSPLEIWKPLRREFGLSTRDAMYVVARWSEAQS